MHTNTNTHSYIVPQFITIVILSGLNEGKQSDKEKKIREKGRMKRKITEEGKREKRVRKKREEEAGIENKR